MSQPKHNIPMSWRRRWMFTRRFAVPGIVWCVCVATFILLASSQTRYIEARGVVQAAEVVVAPISDGTLQGLHVELFQDVEQGEAVALMDDTIVQAGIEQAKAELAAIRERIDAENTDRASEELRNWRRLAVDVEEARLDYLELKAQQEADKVAKERLRVTLDRYQQLAGQNIVDRMAYDNARLQHAELEVRLKENEKTLEAAQRRLAAAEERRDELTPPNGQTLTFTAEINAQEKLILGLAAQGKQLELRSPVTGRVAQVLRRPGENVLAGQPLLTITGNSSGRVLAYVNEEDAHGVKVGDTVHVQSRADAGTIYTAKVLETSPRVEQLPLRLSPAALQTFWGRAVLIGDLPTQAFLPGEQVAVRISR